MNNNKHKITHSFKKNLKVCFTLHLFAQLHDLSLLHTGGSAVGQLLKSNVKQGKAIPVEA